MSESVAMHMAPSQEQHVHNPYATALEIVAPSTAMSQSQSMTAASTPLSMSFTSAAVSPQWVPQDASSFAHGFPVPMAAGQAPPQAPPTFEEVQVLQGSLPEMARTATGSSFLQTALQEGTDARIVGVVWGELAPTLADLLLDAHGCYVIKSLIDRLPADDVRFVLQSIASADALSFSMCTHSLHTRRVVQHIIENIDGCFLCDTMTRHCRDVATTQQGCIVLQRSMDHAYGPGRDALYAAVFQHMADFACDPFGNYVVQHLMEIGDCVQMSNALWGAIRGRIVELSCNKFSSNVIEKCLFHVTGEVQHELLVEMYSAGPDTLLDMLQDSFGNYIIQSSIALAASRDVPFIDEKLRPVLVHTPYGHKIEGKLQRRLKGKPVNSRGAPQSRRPQRKGDRHRDAVPEGEAPW